MESIYYVMSWLCHRTCAHCYEDRFRPYYGHELSRVVELARGNAPRIIDNLPRMVYRDRESGEERDGKIILAGGEILLDPVRESVLYPALQQLRHKYPKISIVVQTTGDTLNEKVIRELMQHGVTTISVSGLDSYHVGIEPAKLTEKLTKLFHHCGLESYTFFGATPDSWIGELWPRGRAMMNELSTATIEHNFCNRWSGGLGFLDIGMQGSEVSIDPEGNVYPCCIKTRKAVGNLLEEPLDSILGRLRGNPMYEAISSGHPERMGLHAGWSEEKFFAKSSKVLPSGREYRNLCVGCDAFHDELVQLNPIRSILR